MRDGELVGRGHGRFLTSAASRSRRRSRERARSPGAAVSRSAFSPSPAARCRRRVRPGGRREARRAGRASRRLRQRLRPSTAVAGFPDVGLLAFTEMLDNARHVVNATSLPTLCDVDTGFGNVTNVTRTIREYEAIGAAGVHIEDQTFPKRCGQTAGATIVDPPTRCASKIYAAKEAQRRRRLRPDRAHRRAPVRGHRGHDRARPRVRRGRRRRDLPGGAADADEFRAVPRGARRPARDRRSRVGPQPDDDDRRAVGVGLRPRHLRHLGDARRARRGARVLWRPALRRQTQRAGSTG